MKIEYYEDMLEQEAINKYLNMIANDYNGELAKIFEEKYINKDKEIERLNNIINELEEEISRHIALCTDITLNDILDKLQELKGSDTVENNK